MNLVTNVLTADLRRMGDDGTQLVGRPVTDPRVLSDHEFFVKHGLTRDQFAERSAMFEREAWEANAVRDIDDVLDCLAGSAADKYLAYHGMLSTEQGRLAELQRKSAELEAIMAQPVEAESALRAALRRTADALLNGKSGDESDADKRAELDAKIAAHRHRAEAAKIALADIGRDIDRQQVRVRHVKSRESEFLTPVIFAAVRESGIVERWEQLRAEADALETQLLGLVQTFSVPAGHSAPWRPPIKRELSTVESRRHWAAVADALQRNPNSQIEI
jgi:hypothetical protein